MIIEELISNIKQNDMEAFQDLYEVYQKQVYYTVYSLFKDKNIAEKLLQSIFVKVYKSRKKLSENENFEDKLYTITGDIIRKFRSKKDKSYNVQAYEELMGFVYEFPSKLREESLTEQDYERIFEEIRKEVLGQKPREVKLNIDIKGYVLRHKKIVAAILAVIIAAGVYGYWNKIRKQSSAKEKAEQHEGIGEKPKNYQHIPDYNKVDRIVYGDNVILLSEPGNNGKAIRVLDIAQSLEINDAVRHDNGSIWLQVKVYDSSRGSEIGWLPEGNTRILLAESYGTDTNRYFYTYMNKEDAWKLAEEFLSSLKSDTVPESHRIEDYKINDAGLLYLTRIDEYKGEGVITFDCEIKPYSPSDFNLVTGFSISDNGYMENIHIIGEVVMRGNHYSLIRMDTGSKEEKISEIAAVLGKNNLMLYNGSKGFVIGKTQVILPRSNTEDSSIDEVIRLYLAYCNEFSKAVGYDFSVYAGETADVTKYELVCREWGPSFYSLVTLEIGGMLRGYWLELDGDYHDHFALASLDRRRFNDLVIDKDSWLNKGDFKNISDNPLRVVELTTAYIQQHILRIIPNKENSITLDKAVDMAIHMVQDEKLIKEHFVIEKKEDTKLMTVVDEVLKQYFENLNDNRLSKYSRVEDYSVHEATLAYESRLEYMFDILVDIKVAERHHTLFKRISPSDTGWMNRKKLSVSVEKSDESFIIRVREPMQD
jgi:DNA-directed RNA polymerase specialized sigma24 family protein